MDFNKMDKEALIQMMFQQIQELENEGLVDENFRECYLLKEYNGPLYFLDLISVFLKDVKAGVKNMTKALEQPVVNYKALQTQGMKLKGSSLSFGVCPVKDSSEKLCNAINNESKEGCLQALQIINNDYDALYNRMAIIMKIEQEIVSRDRK